MHAFCCRWNILHPPSYETVTMTASYALFSHWSLWLAARGLPTLTSRQWLMRQLRRQQKSMVFCNLSCFHDFTSPSPSHHTSTNIQCTDPILSYTFWPLSQKIFPPFFYLFMILFNSSLHNVPKIFIPIFQISRIFSWAGYHLSTKYRGIF